MTVKMSELNKAVKGRELLGKLRDARGSLTNDAERSSFMARWATRGSNGPVWREAGHGGSLTISPSVLRAIVALLAADLDQSIAQLSAELRGLGVDPDA